MGTAFLVGVFTLAVATIVLVTCGLLKWKADMQHLRDRLVDAQHVDPIGVIELNNLSLPPPVKRYLKIVLTPGQRLIASAEFHQTGQFNLGLGTGQGEKDNWKPFRATQLISTRRPGFIWDARIFVAPKIAVTVCDAYIAGEGILVGKLLGVFKLLEFRATKESSESELMRFLAEAPWFPTALIPDRQLTWSSGDNEHSATAHLSDGHNDIAALFRFNSDGLIESVEMQRLRLVDGRSVRTRWIGQFRGYEWREGMLVPGAGEVSWSLPDGNRSYWRGELNSVKYTFHDRVTR